MKRYQLFILILLLLTPLLGCSEDEAAYGEGTVELTWSAGPIDSCEILDIQVVEIEALKKGELISRSSFECEAKTGIIDRLSAGSYDFHFTGIDSEGRRAYEGQLQAIEITADQMTAANELRLNASEAKVELLWVFDNGRFCAHNSVDTVLATVYDASFYELGVMSFGCEDGRGTLMPLRAGGYLVELQGLTQDEAIVAVGLRDFEVERGGESVIEITLGL